MSVQFQIQKMPDYLAVRFTGRMNEAWRKFASIAESCKRAKKNKLLLDFTEAQGDMSLADRYILAVKVEDFMIFKIRVAAVGILEQFDFLRLAETVTQSRWINFRAFTRVEDAEEWLLAGAPKVRGAGHH